MDHSFTFILKFSVCGVLSGSRSTAAAYVTECWASCKHCCWKSTFQMTNLTILTGKYNHGKPKHLVSRESSRYWILCTGYTEEVGNYLGQSPPAFRCPQIYIQSWKIHSGLAFCCTALLQWSYGVWIQARVKAALDRSRLAGCATDFDNACNTLLV